MLLAVLLAPGAATGQGHISQDEALRLAFPEPASIERRTAFLDDADRQRISRKAGSEFDAGVVTYYVGIGPDGPLGVAWFDVHRVRTLPEVLMIVVSPERSVRRVEVLRFAEPPDYAPPPGWLERFVGRGLDMDLEGKEPVAGMTGATLTSRAVTAAVRRALALQDVIRPLEAAP